MPIIFTDSFGRRLAFTRTAPSKPLPGVPMLWNHDEAQRYLTTMRSTTPRPWQTLWREWHPAQLHISDDAIHDRLAKELVAKKLWLVPEAQARTPGSAPGAALARGEIAETKAAPAAEEWVPVKATAATPPPSTQPDDQNAIRTATPGKVSTDATVGAAPFSETETNGCPISMVSGEEVLPILDATLPGPVPFAWQRFYRTGHRRDIGLGLGWTHSGVEALRVEANVVVLSDSEGHVLSFARPAVHQRSRLVNEGLDLDAVSDDSFILKQPGQPDKVFTRRGAGDIFDLSQMRHPGYRPARPAVGEPARGYCLEFHYDTRGRLARVDGNWGKGLCFARNASGRVTSVALENTRTGAAQRIADYDYDADGHLIAHRNANGAGERYAYTHGLLTQRTLASGFRYYYEWDGTDTNARCIRTWGDNGIYDYRFRWDPENHASCATDSRGNTTTYVYDDFGHIVHKIDPEGGVHRYTYTDGRLTAYTDPNGAVTQYLYDDANRPAGTRDALGNYRTLSYFQGRPTEVSDATGATWRRSYTSSGQLETVTDPMGAVTRFTYTPDGLVRTITDAAGRTLRYDWNDRAELLRETDPHGHTIHYSYDDFGRLVERFGQLQAQPLAAARQSATRFEYTATGHIAAVTDAQGRTTRYSYDASDQLTHYTDAVGRTIQYRYKDKLAQPTERIDPLGHVVRYAYDTERNLIALINENGDRYRFAYDGNERLIEETGFDGRTQHYHYDAAGHLVRHLDSGEVQTDFERNALGQLQTKTSRRLGQTDTIERTRYRHDAAGRLLETYNEHQYLTFTYDPLGRILTETQCDLNTRKERQLRTEAVIAHRYNLLGQRTQTLLPDGQRLDYAFDASQAFQSVSINDAIIATVTRDSLGREINRIQGALTTHTDYDPQGRLQRQAIAHTERRAAIVQRDYGYDPFGNLSFIKDGHEETKYVYDALNRLTRADGAAPECFAFDPAGNLLAMSDSVPTAPGFVKGNRLLIQGDKKFGYDARGNLIKETRGKDGKLQKQYSYDLNNQLIEVKSTQRDQTVRFRYDPLGRRI